MWPFAGIVSVFVSSHLLQVCGEVITAGGTTIPALGHEWDAGTVTTEPTCTEPGEKTYTFLTQMHLVKNIQSSKIKLILKHYLRFIETYYLSEAYLLY